MKKLIVGAFSAFIAVTPAAAAEWGPWERITGLLVHDNSLELTITGPGSGCERVYRLKTVEENYDVKATAALSAFYAGYRVSLFWTGDRSSCHTQVKRIKVRP